MRHRTPLVLVTGVLAVGLIVRGSPVMSGGSVLERWTETMRAKQWVAAFLDTSRPGAVPAGSDLIVVKIGGEERIVYVLQPTDVYLTGPSVSPDGTKIAFFKVDVIAGAPGKPAYPTDEVRQRVYGMDVDGSNLRPLADMIPLSHAIRGVYIRMSPLAWSHDNQKIVFQDGAPGTGFANLMLLDIPSGKPPERLAEVGPFEAGRVIGPAITNQAWAPDNRRIVYMNARGQGHVIILDTVTRKEEDLGVGREPTWSPDGRFIAIQIRGEKGSGRTGDHLLISPAPPYQRTLLLSNARTLFSWRGLGYVSPALWFPDSRYLMFHHHPPEAGAPYVLDRSTGEIAKLHPRLGGHSWGGRP